MDWLEGPFAGMQPGPHGDGAALLFELMAHLTRPEFHLCARMDARRSDCVGQSLSGARGDLVRCRKERRMMWRTTVSGNPGAVYAGERKSWVQA